MVQMNEAPLGALGRLKTKALAGLGVRSAKADKAAMGKAKQLYGIWQKTSASANLDPTKENLVNWLRTHKVDDEIIKTGFSAIGQDVASLLGGTKQISGPAAGSSVNANVINQMKAATTPDEVVNLLGQFKAAGKTRIRDILPSAMKLSSAVGIGGPQIIANAQKLVDSGKMAQISDLEKVGLALLIASQKVTLPAATAAPAAPAGAGTPPLNPTGRGRLPGARSPQGAAPKP